MATLSTIRFPACVPVWFDNELLTGTPSPDDTLLIAQHCSGLLGIDTAPLSADTGLPRAATFDQWSLSTPKAEYAAVVSELAPLSSLAADIESGLFGVGSVQSDSLPRLLLRFFVAPPVPPSRRPAAAFSIAAPRLGHGATESALARSGLHVSATQPFASSAVLSHSFGVIFADPSDTLRIVREHADSVQRHYPSPISPLLDLRMAEICLDDDHLSQYLNDMTEEFTDAAPQ